jgi:hypothetical protein
MSQNRMHDWSDSKVREAIRDAMQPLIARDPELASHVIPAVQAVAIRIRDECSAGAFDFEAHIVRQIEFSARTFGPGARTSGVIDHIRKELSEIEADPSDIYEWIDVIILGLDGAWRAGFTPSQIVEALVAKQSKNEARDWPDWRTVPMDKAIEHNRNSESEEP